MIVEGGKWARGFMILFCLFCLCWIFSVINFFRYFNDKFLKESHILVYHNLKKYCDDCSSI